MSDHANTQDVIASRETCLPERLREKAAGVCRLLAESGRRLALAESCTGGLIAAAVTEIPGASAVFERGVVAYSNEAKIDLLTVPLVFIEQYGAVSAETAGAMAEGAVLISKADVAAAVTGIAGPDGGGERKPVGLVYIAFADKHSGKPASVSRHVFQGDRASVRLQAACAVLDYIEACLPGLSKPAGRKEAREKAVV